MEPPSPAVSDDGSEQVEEEDAHAKEKELKKHGRDLLTELSSIMAEKGRLAQLAAEITPAAQTDDEFGRFVRQAIQFLDGLDRIIELGRKEEQSEEFQGWFSSVEAVYERIATLFEQHDLRALHCMGQEVDFSLHDVIEYRRTRDHPHNTVIEEIRKGYVFRGRILRDAKVVVACNE